MKSMKEQISPTMLMFAIVCFVQASTSLSAFVVSVLKQEAWICVVLGYLISLPVIWVYLKLAELYPQKTLIEINDSVFGKKFGKLFSLFYLWFFFSLVFLNVTTISAFVVNYVLPETPLMAIVLMFVFVCVYSVRKGVETVTRYGSLFVVVVVIYVGINSTLLVQHMKLSNFLPLFVSPVIKYVQASHTMAILPLCEIMAFMMLFPNVEKGKNIKKPVFLSLTFGAITFLITISRDTAVLGALSAYLELPSFEVLRLINISNTLTKVEVFYIFLLIILQFFKTSVLLYSTAKSAEQIFGLSSYKVLSTVIGALAAVFAMIAFKTQVDNNYWGRNIAAHYSTFFEVILPVTTLIVAVVRKSCKGQKEVGAS